MRSQFTTKKQTIMLLLKGGLTEEDILKLPKITQQDIDEAKQEYNQLSKTIILFEANRKPSHDSR